MSKPLSISLRDLIQPELILLTYTSHLRSAPPRFLGASPLSEYLDTEVISESVSRLPLH